jgi:hypothetical protein
MMSIAKSFSINGLHEKWSNLENSGKIIYEEF